MNSPDALVNIFSWLLPLSYLIHVLEEYYIGSGFPSWFSTMFNAGLSEREFIVINIFGMLTMITCALINSIRKAADSFLVALYTLILVNGIIHLLASLISMTYSPGLVTGVFIYIPLSVYFFRTIFPNVPARIKRLGILTGITVQILVSVIALNV
jgi:Protein of unknown function with HXXEE motif